MKNNKKTTAKIAGILAAFNLAAFLIFYLFNYHTDSMALFYISYYLIEFFNFLLPLAVAVAVFHAFTSGGFKSAFVCAIFFSMSKIIYLLPTGYLNFMSAGYISSDAILLSLLEALLYSALLYCISVLLFLLMLFATGKFAKIDCKNPEAIKKEGAKRGFFDFSIPIALSFFSCALVPFVISLVKEVIDTVTFLLNYSGTYRLSEILYILMRFVFILVYLFASHVICIGFKNLLFKEAE